MKEPEITEVLPSSPVENADEALLAALGYKQEFRRHFSPLQVFGLAFSIVGLVSSFSSVLIYSIPYGGPVAMVWGWVAAAGFLFMLALALAELASAAPTSGGLYYWAYAYSSDRYQNFLCWIVGYANTISNVAGVASIEWGCAVQIMAAAQIGTGFETSNSHLFGVFIALLIVHGMMNTLTPKFIAKMQVYFTLLNVILCCVVIVVLPGVTPRASKNSASFAFGQFQNFSGWGNGSAFILSLLTPAWTSGAMEAAIHMSEEAVNATTAIPFTIILSSLSTLILGWAINIALSFSMGNDIGAIIGSPVGQPMATILLRSFGKKGALVVWVFVILAQFAIGAGQLTTCSRQVFAFTRDGALPFSKWLYEVDKRTGAPIRSVWCSVFLSALLGVITFAGPNASSAVFALVITGQYTAYCIPITARWIGGKEFRPGAVSYGKWSILVTILSLSWMVFMSVIVMFPASPNPGIRGMNYTVVVHAGVLLLATIYYFLPRYGGRHWFRGPIPTIEDTRGTERPTQLETKVKE
ncbi:APC amino acid permease [Marasmius fiardii PR-910]|nr:APC amino acid permease [Marasmius fiardii PR-910]